MTIRLAESATAQVVGTRARIRIISEGIGSSGTYPADVIQRDGPAAWPAGTQIFMDHLTESDQWERDGSHSVKDLVGVFESAPEFDAADNALYANARFFEAHAPLIKDIWEYVGLSVEAGGTITDGIVEAIHYSPLNAVAIVPRAGRGGKITALIESYRETHGKIMTEGADAPAEPGKDKGMTPEDIQKIAEALALALAPSLSEIKEALKPAPVVVTEDATADVATVTEALVAAGLPESARKRVYEGLKTDPKADVAKVIEAEKAYVAEITETFKATAETDTDGTLREAAKNGVDFSIGAWK